MRHRRGDASGQRLDERKTGGDTILMIGGERLTLHDSRSSEVAHGDVPRCHA
jgi:hypothetical protein